MVPCCVLQQEPREGECLRLVARYPEPSLVSSSKARLASDSSIFITQSSSLLAHATSI